MNKQDIEKLMSIEPQVLTGKDAKHGPEPSLREILERYYTSDDFCTPEQAVKHADEYLDKLVEAL